VCLFAGQARSWFERANSIRIVRNALISKDSEDKNTCACAALYSATVAEPARDDDSDEEEEDSSSSSSSSSSSNDVDGSGDSSSGEEDSSGGAKPPTPPNKRMFGNSRREAPGEESTGGRSSLNMFMHRFCSDSLMIGLLSNQGGGCGSLRKPGKQSTGEHSSDQVCAAIGVGGLSQLRCYSNVK
jgi:hypothetical protein